MDFSSLSHARRGSASFALPVLWAPDQVFYLFLCVLASWRETLLAPLLKILLPSWRDVPTARKIKLQSHRSV
jgi:hypothetical protein